MPAISIPAPVGGWNASDALDRMPATDAVRMVNMIPRTGFVQTRRGYLIHCSGLGGPVETLSAWRGPAADKLIAGANGRLWDASTGTPSSLASGFVNNRWQVVNHSGLLIFLNGANTPQVYNGTALSNLSATGPTIATLWAGNSFKGRAFYWSENEQRVWYAAAGSYQGTLSAFNFGPFLTTGGSLVQMLNWTNDGGDGVDDYAVFVFSTGEVLVYQGDDPGNASAWALIGRFQIGEPLGPRAHAKVGGTEIILTRDGYVDLSVALRDGRYSERSAYSSKIIRAAKEAARDYGGFMGWEAVLYPAGQQFIVNVPTSNASSLQHVRETSSGGWCEFSGMNALAFAVFGDRLYFGDPDGRVFLADEDDTDNGANIFSLCVPAFNTLGTRATRKQITAAAAVTDYQFPAGIALDGLADFNLSLRSTVVEGAAQSPGFWDVSDWDTTDWAQQGDTLPTTQPFRNLSAIGYSLTVAFRINQRAQNVRWYATNIIFRQAGAV